MYEYSKERSQALHLKHFFPLAQRLARGDWFTSRISACSLLACVYRRLPPDRPDVRKECIATVSILARDETPMVRRAAASYLGDMTRALAETDPSLVESEVRRSATKSYCNSLLTKESRCFSSSLRFSICIPISLPEGEETLRFLSASFDQPLHCNSHVLPRFPHIPLVVTCYCS